MSTTPACVMAVAGSDSSGGAGIQADIKTITALGGYASAVVTAVTVQDRSRVYGVVDIAPSVIAHQMRVVLADVGADCIKTGMLATVEAVEAVSEVVNDQASEAVRVVDPVMVSAGGDRLVSEEAADALGSALVVGGVVTPNAPEAAWLTGIEVSGVDGQRRAAEALLNRGAAAVLVKGGHIAGNQVRDVLAHGDGEEIMTSARIGDGAPHGTGCTLASAIAVYLARGESIVSSCDLAREYLRLAMSRTGLVSERGVLLYHGWPHVPG